LKPNLREGGGSSTRREGSAPVPIMPTAQEKKNEFRMGNRVSLLREKRKQRGEVEVVLCFRWGENE